jgi:hypothetical protein
MIMETWRILIWLSIVDQQFYIMFTFTFNKYFRAFVEYFLIIIRGKCSKYKKNNSNKIWTVTAQSVKWRAVGSTTQVRFLANSTSGIGTDVWIGQLLVDVPSLKKKYACIIFLFTFWSLHAINFNFWTTWPIFTKQRVTENMAEVRICDVKVTSVQINLALRNNVWQKTLGKLGSYCKAYLFWRT